MISIHPLNVACKHREPLSQHVFGCLNNVVFLYHTNSAPHHLKQRQITLSNIIIVDFDINPARVLCSSLDGQAVAPVVDLRHEEELLCGRVDAVVELASKKVHSHDAKDEPEDQTDQQHIEDGRNRPNESIHHHLPNRDM